MTTVQNDTRRLLSTIVGHLDVPKSYYEKAANRHRTLGEWLHRKESKVAAFNPNVRPQGSFRFGTVNRPVREGEEYDLDNVCVLQSLNKTTLTQKQLKELYGVEIREYAAAHGMVAPVVERNRCWRLQYADEVRFHLDTLPCVPEDATVVARLAEAGVPAVLAECAVAITDRKHPKYDQLVSAWLSSNPRGFARWFERQAALGLVRQRSEGRAKAAVEDVPPYEWKTPLQQSIQVLKRHRDVMFYKNPDLAPISMIITNLAAKAYAGETDLGDALSNIVGKMANFVQASRPRVPNPADPAEDYADKWMRNEALEKNFWRWMTAVKADVAKLPSLLQSGRLSREVSTMFLVELTQDEVDELEGMSEGRVPATVKAPGLIIPSASRPWGGQW